MRVLSMMVCLALLMSTVPVDLPFASALATEADAAPEVVAADVPAPEPEEVPEAPAVEPEALAPEPTEAPAEEPVETQAPEATEVPAVSEETADSDAPVESEPVEQPEVPDAPQAPEETEIPAETGAPEPTEDPNAIDYSADAGQSRAFQYGLAEVIYDDTLVFEGAGAEAEARAKIGRGVVYVSGRTGENDSPDRVKIAFNAGPEVGMDGGWVDASAVRPMEPTQEIPAYLNFCAERDDLQLLFYQDLAELPLARIACVYRASEESAAPEATQAPAAAEEPAEEPTPVATEHPIFMPEEPADDVIEGEPGDENDENEDEEIADEADAAETEEEDGGEAEDDEAGMPEAQDELLDGADEIEAAINQDELEMYVGRAQQLNLTLPEGVVPMLTSSDIRVATVSQDGVVKAIAPGEAKITLVAGDEIDTCQVKSETAPTITLQADSLKIAVGESYDLPGSGFVTCSGEEPKLSFTSLNPNIATVTEGGMLKGVAKGTATIRVVETKSTVNKDIQVNVQAAATGVTVRDRLMLSLGMNANLNLAFSPADSYYSYTIWSENPSIAGVTQDGVVTALGVGTTTILVETGNGLSDSCAVTVEAVPESIWLDADEITLVAGETGARINATAYDAQLNEVACDFVYEVASPQIVTVKDGVLTTVGPGQTTVTVKAANAENVSAVCTVNVLSKAQGITLRRSSIALGVGDTFQISDEDYDGTLYDGIIATDGDNTGVLSYSYRSTRTKYATVSSTGLITAKKAGYSDIVITPSDGAKAVTLRVNVSNAAGSVSFNRSELVIGAGGTAELSVVFPSKTAADYTISSNDEDGLITFERNGTTNTWTLKAAEVFNKPTVTFTVTSRLRGYEDTCAVTIMPGPAKIELTANKPLVDGKYVIGVGEPNGKVTASFAADEENRVGGFEYAGTSALTVGKTDGTLTANAAATSTTVTARATVPYAPGQYAMATAEFEVKLSPNTIKLKSSSISMGVGDTYSLTDDPDGILVLDPVGSQTNYSFAASAKSNKSAKTSVLTVDANTGLITAKKAGTAYVKITPKSGSDRTAKTLTVKVSKATGTISLNAGVKRLGVGMKDTLTVSFSSKCYGRFNVSVEDSVPASGLDEPVIKLTQSGQTIQLEALHPGKATVKVETEARKYVDTCCVTVVEAPTDEELMAGLTVPAEIGVGETGQTVSLSYPEDKLAKVTFKSTMPSILDVNATTGALTAKGAGDAAIYVVVNDVEHQKVLKAVKVVGAPTAIVVEPSSLTIEVGRTYQIDTSKIALTPETARVSYDYKSSKTKYATVSGTGLITGKKVGSSTITVSSKQNSKVCDTISVRVVKKGTTFAVNPATVSLGVGMRSKVSAAKAPAGTLTYESSNADVVQVTDPATGEIQATGVGTALITAKMTSGEGEAQKTTVSAAATVTVLPAPSAEQITFSADSVERISANQKNAKVTATIPSDTKAEIGYRIQGATPAGIALNGDTGAMTAGANVPGSGSFTVEAYDKNNPTVCASREVKMVPAARMTGLTASTISLGVGESFRITDGIKLDPADGFASFTFTSYKTYKKGKLSSKNSTYASVNATTGVITGKKAGTNYIQISCDNGGSAVLTVKVYSAPSTATLSPATLELGVGMTGQLKSNYASGNRYESSNDQIAAVDAATGLVTAKGAGYATITVTTWNNKTDTSLIHVVNAPSTVHMEPAELTIGMKQKNVKVVATPGEEGTMATFSYASNAPQFATVDPNTGVLTPVAPGTATITATAQGNPGVTGTATVTVKAAPGGLTLNTGAINLGIGDTYQINDGAREKPDILPSDSDPSSVHASYSYYASTKSNKNKKTSVATVSATGLITGKKAGTAYVRISDQAGHTQPMKVVVYKRATSATLSKSDLTLSEGMESTLTVNFPKKTYVGFEVENSNPDAVDVAVSGQTITVTALQANQEATITLRTVNGLVDTCHVFAMPAPKAVNLQLVPGTGSYLANAQGNEITIGVGESNARIVASTDEEYIPCNFEYSSNDTSAVTVNGSGVLSARSAGKVAKVTVKVKYGAAYIRAKGQVAPPSATVTVHTLAGPAKGQLTLAQGTVTMGVGDTYQIEEYHLDENGQSVGVIKIPDNTSASYSYKSSNTKVATVSGAGLVTAKKAGTTKIRITAQNNKKVYKDLTISVKNYTSSMSILPSVALGAGMTGSVGTKFSSNAYGLVEYVSSDPAVVAVNPSTGALTAAGPDAINEVKHATITATLQRSGKTNITDTCYVTVLPEPQTIAIAYDEIKGVETDASGTRFVRIGVNEAGVKIFAYCVEPNTMCDYAFAVDRAGLSVDASGTLKATTASEDYYTVTVTANNNKNATAQVKVKVVAWPTGVSFTPGTLSLGVGDTYQLKETADGGIIKLSPENVTSASFSYAASSKSNKIKSTSVLTVNSAGLITAKKTGTAYVKVSTQNGKYKFLTVKVYNKPASISLSPETLTIGELSTGKVSVVYPANTHSEIASFASSDENLLSVDLGGNITVKKLADGKAKDVTITATTQSGVSGKATITVLPHPATLSFTQASYELSTGMSLATAIRLPEGTMAQHFKYESDNANVATIDASGVLTGTNATGADQTANITVTANPDTDCAVTSDKVTVTVHPAPASITYEGTGLEGGLVLTKGDTVAIPEPLAYTAGKALVPANFTFTGGTSGKTTVVSIKDGKMTAAAAGTATITATAHNSTKENPITATLKVTVSTNVPSKLELYDGGVLVGENGKPGALAMYVNAQHPTDTVALTAKVTGADVNCGSVSFESSAPAVVEVSANGVLTALKEGSATITATTGLGGLEAKCEVTVGKLCDTAALATAKSLELSMGQTKQIEFTFSPSNTGMRMRYASSAADVASADPDGKITAVGGGTAKIAITGQYGWSDAIDVKVLHNPDSVSLPVRKLYMKAPEKVEPAPEEGEPTYNYDSVELAPVLAKSGVADLKDINLTTSASSDNASVEVTVNTPMDQAQGKAATYTLTAKDTGSAKVTISTNDGNVKFVLEVVVGAESAETGFGWNPLEGQELVIMAGDTAPLELALTSELFKQGEGEGFTVEVDKPEVLEVKNSDIIAKAEGTAKLTLKCGGAERDTQEIRVVAAVAPKLYYGAGENPSDPIADGSAIELDVTGYTVENAKHLIRIDPLPGWTGETGYMLLGTFAVEISSGILSYIAENQMITTTSSEGQAKVTVTTGGGAVSVDVTVLDKPVYRALLISEYNGSAQTSNNLPFAQISIDLVRQTLGQSVINGQRYKISEVPKNSGKAAIKQAIMDTFKGAKKNDVSLIFFLAHGHNTGKEFHFSLSVGSTKYSTKNSNTYVSDSDLMSWVKNSEANNGNVVLVLNGCHTGGFIRYQSKALNAAKNIAVLTTQIYNKRGAYYVGKYKDVTTFEFLARAFCAALGNTLNVGSGDPWKNQNRDASGGDKQYTIQEVFAASRTITQEMVNAYCYKNSPYFTSNAYGFKCGASSGKQYLSWWDNGNSQVPQLHIPNEMKDLVFFGRM